MISKEEKTVSEIQSHYNKKALHLAELGSLIWFSSKQLQKWFKIKTEFGRVQTSDPVFAYHKIMTKTLHLADFGHWLTLCQNEFQNDSNSHA